MSKIDQVRAKLEGHEVDDNTIKRFLDARRSQVDQAANSILKLIQWRNERELDTLKFPPDAPVLTNVRGFKSVPDSNVDFSLLFQEGQVLLEKAKVSKNDYYNEYYLKKYLALIRYHGGNCYHKFDKTGHPVYIERIGLHKARDLVTDDESVWQNYHVIGQEFMERCLMKEAAEKNSKIDKITVIMDCAGMGFHQLYLPALQIVKGIAEMDQAYYPERLAKLYVVNAPWMFTSIWSIIKMWMDENMLNKIKILGNDFKDVIKQDFDLRDLPEFLGGECKCEHMTGGCVPIPREMYDECKSTFPC